MPGLEVIKHFSFSTQLGMEFIMLIIVKMPTIIGILTFISMMNTASGSSKARKVLIVGNLGLNELLIPCSVEFIMKSVL